MVIWFSDFISQIRDHIPIQNNNKDHAGTTKRGHSHLTI